MLKKLLGCYRATIASKLKMLARRSSELKINTQLRRVSRLLFQSGLTRSCTYERISKPGMHEPIKGEGGRRGIRHRNLSRRVCATEFLGNGFVQRDTQLKEENVMWCMCALYSGAFVAAFNRRNYMGEYVTLYAHKDHLIARKRLPVRLSQRLSGLSKALPSLPWK